MDAKERWENIDQMLEEKTKRLVTLPLLDSFVVENNFKGLPTILSRYKFVAKMLEGKKNIVEVGCNAGFKTMLLAQFVENVYGIDYDAEQISFAKENFENKQARFLCKDIFDVKGSVNGIENDGIFALDVIEHIPKEKEDLFIGQMVQSIHKDGICIIGTPNITAAPYQSETSKAAHINLYSYDRLKNLMDRHFKNTFLFCMNDEMVHVGFPQMAHYLLVMGVAPK
jgi:2-polyprenyl-3-methyl-5-hydroxy-6-metoxy-1,4-benzoquinol methylase